MGRKNTKGRGKPSRHQKNLSPIFQQNAIGDYLSNDIDGDVLREMNITEDFPQAVLDEVRDIVAREPDPKVLLNDPERQDLTNLPFITIDGEDARDFDDAVYAYPDTDGANKGGHVLWVAIADVSHYVQKGSALDKEAKRRGATVYLPGKVVPMLPEELSNGLCSLKPNEYRAVSAYKMKISAEGKVLNYQFCTGVIKSQARLTYNQVLDALEGRPDAQTQPILSTLLEPLHNVSKSCKIDRKKRKAIEFDTSELGVHVDRNQGKTPQFSIIKGDDARTLIEEAMISANISAGKDQTNNCAAGAYRVQDQPEVKKNYTARILAKLGVNSARRLREGMQLTQGDFVNLLGEAKSSKDPDYAKGLILRMQMRATYSANNIGHFCLALPEYSHFTSPIRRYPDLMTHRNLKAAFNLKSGYALDAETAETDMEHCADMERLNDAAGREARKRYVMRFLHDKQGQELEAEILSVNQNELRLKIGDCNYFTSLSVDELPKGAYQHDRQSQSLINTQTGHKFTVGDKPKVTVQFGLHGALPTVFISNLPQYVVQQRPGPKNTP